LVGVFYLQHKYFVKALACFKRSLSIRTSVLGERDESVADCWYNMAVVYKQIGKKLKAIEYLERTLTLRR
jgi:tetratricopeptide (TPR) repeat protein